METQNIRSRGPLTSFIRYCVTHPEERFWQSLLNWSKYRFIFLQCDEGDELLDPFMWEGRRHDGKES